MRMKILGLMCAIALFGPARATEGAPAATSPTMQDMLEWKSKVLSKYGDITYLDADSKQVSEDVFFSRVVAEKRGIKVQIESGAQKRVTVRLLSDAEQRAAQAGVK